MGKGEPQSPFCNTHATIDRSSGRLRLPIGLEADIVEQRGFGFLVDGRSVAHLYPPAQKIK